MASGQRFQDEDWLGGYLANTKYGADPKLNADPSRSKAKKSSRSAGPRRDNAGSSKSGAGAGEGAGAGSGPPPASSSGYSLAVPAAKGNGRRRSWAAPPSLAQGSGGRANPAEAAATAALAAATRAAAAATERKAEVAASSAGTAAKQAKIEGGGSAAPSSIAADPNPPRPEHSQDLAAALTVAAAKVVNSAGTGSSTTGKRLAPSASVGQGDGGGHEEWQEEFDQKTSNFRRKSFSGSGRRVSLDYTDLEAVKERVQQAASLWAVAEDNERESMSSTGSKGETPKVRPPPRSTASQAAAAARAIATGQAMPDEDDGDEDDDEDDSMDGQEPSVASNSAATLSGMPHQGSPSKKVSLIKKWLLFRK